MPEIAQRDECAGYPSGTLWAIYHGTRRAPKQYKIKTWDSLWDLSKKEIVWLMNNRQEVGRR